MSEHGVMDIPSEITNPVEVTAAVSSLINLHRAGVCSTYLSPLKRQSHKMVKHAQTIRRQIADELFECV